MPRMLLVFLLICSAPAYADVAGGCPAAVTTGILKAFPKATIGACKAEREHGKDLFEVKLTKASGDKIEVDVAPDGTILQVEEKIAVDALPEPVKKAFAARYPRGRATGAEKQTAGKDVRYEIAFQTDKGRKEASFSADGTFVEEE
ncbi:MAG TPA: hypothetical protein VF469_40370 [Kofleriaceae bacterium]